MPARSALAFQEIYTATFTLRWEPATGPVVGYFVYRSLNGEPYQFVATTPAADPSITLASLPGQDVRFRVSAIDAQGNEGPLSTASERLFGVPIFTGLDAHVDREAAVVLVGWLPNAESTEGTGVMVEAFGIGGDLLATAAYRESDLPAGVDPAALAQVRGAACDLEGDGEREVVLSFGVGSQAMIEIRSSVDTAMQHVRWLQVTDGGYLDENGETFCACGDVDGDGRDEILVSLGPGGAGQAFLYDDLDNDLAWLRDFDIQWPSYAEENGESRPALGDFDGDGLDEIVLGLGTGGNGYMMVYDDALRSYRRYATPYGSGWLLADWPEYDAENGETFPTLGDIDGDGIDEIVVGFGRGGLGRIRIYDDITGYLRPYPTLEGGFTAIEYGVYQGLVGITRPYTVDLDGDGEEEILIALGADIFGRIRSSGQIRVLHGASLGFTVDDGRARYGTLEFEPWHRSPRGTSVIGR